MRRHSLRSLASILIWIGAVEIAACFLAKMLFHFTAFQAYNPIFFAAILVGIVLLVLVRI
ncbi:hypothetical protein DNHGIG_30450 [Collibacillus ludicampi]|uniref:Uncharacterized protein n=1 Tax=Collibacillus ludicampi TaxID=2771369 RepID=A0AAV4LI34_9BACL|nr:hypothetical protein [Collibacillus ludicampi]GIM47496.1 hypothetical protein DNHGIG_30450 [Collibacillus ludicampi]